MGTTTKKELTNSISSALRLQQTVVRDVIQAFLDACTAELAEGNRLEFRDFGVFETVERKPRRARNPRTGDAVAVPAKRAVKFKIGRLMKQKLQEGLERAQG